jgi:hypothetical protein
MHILPVAVDRRGKPWTETCWMKKLKLAVEELTVESFDIDVAEELGTVVAAEAGTKRTFECPCYESISCFC